MKGGRESGPERIPIWINSRWQIAAGEDKALLIKSDAAPSQSVFGEAPAMM